MKKIFSILLVMVLYVFYCGYKFPDNIPKPYEINTYYLDKLFFGQTSIVEFQCLAPDYEHPTTEGVYTIFEEYKLNNDYKSLRIGFKSGFLDFLELDFAVPQSWSKFKYIYGNPISVNTDYSKKFNYHDYGFFNALTDKNNVSVFSITIFGVSGFSQDLDKFMKKLPNYKNFNFINEFIPGKYQESEFKQSYPNMLLKDESTANHEYYMDKKYMVSNPYYSEVSLLFQNGILTFVNLKPKNLIYLDITKIYGMGKQLSTSKKGSIMYDYNNFVITVDKQSKKVTDVGIVNAN